MKRIGLDLCSLSGERAIRGIGIYALYMSRALLNLVRAGKATNLQFYLFSFMCAADLEKLLGPLPSNVRAIRVWGGRGRLQILLGHQLGLTWLAARYRLDVLHSLGYGVDPSQPGLPALLPPTARLTTMHDLIPLHYPEVFLTVRRKRLWYALMLHRAKNSNCILTNSEHTRQDVIETLRVAPARIKCTPFAADQFAQPPTDLERPDQSFVLTVGGPAPHKNMARLLQAFAQWQTSDDSDQTARLVITGAGDSQTALANNLPAHLKARVTWLNAVDSQTLADLYHKARFLAFPSLYEGFGLPILEAMQQGCPVLCSHIAALPEVGGTAVYYVNQLDVNDIAKGLARLWSDSTIRQKLQAAGLAQAQKFAWRHTAALTLEIYQKL